MRKRVHKDSLDRRRTVVLSDSIINGDIRISGDLSLEGKVNGSICCDGSIVVEKGAGIAGDVLCKELDLKGEIGGMVKADKIVLREGSGIKGRVETTYLKIVTEKINIKELRLTENKRIT